MAQYKVPQDVEADDKLVGPFSFRQFVYLMIAGGLIAMAVGLAQLFPLLAIIPLPPVLLFLALALPLKKDQPMEAYLAAIVSYYLKPRTRVWKTGQRDSTIKITAPKKKEAPRTRDITGEEATHRLSFLADIVDTEGYAIKGIQPNTNIREELIDEVNTATDIFEGTQFDNLQTTIVQDEAARYMQMTQQVQGTINVNEGGGIEYNTTGMAGMPRTVTSTTTTEMPMTPSVAPPTPHEVIRGPEILKKKISAAVVLPEAGVVENSKSVTGVKPVENSPQKVESQPVENSPITKTAKPSIIELANNDAFSVATIEKEARRLKRKEEGEVFISLH